MIKILVLCIISIVRAKDCKDGVSCVVHDSSDVKSLVTLELDVLSSTSGSTASDVTETESPETTLPSTESATKAPTTTSTPAPTLPPSIAARNNNWFCWCDLIVGVCDINCCCDDDCSFYQKLIFTHCIDSNQKYDQNKCYSSNFFYKKPSSVKTEESQGLFCVIKDNISYKKEYKIRKPAETIDEFKSLLKKRKVRILENRQISPHFSAVSYKDGSVIWIIQNKKIVPFEIPSMVYGDYCLSKIPIIFLQDTHSKCKIRIKNGNQSSCSNVFKQFLNYSNKLISKPQNLDNAHLQSSIQNCSTLNACIPISFNLCKNERQCNEVKNISSIINPKNCHNFGLKIQFIILHNGTGGLHSVNVSIIKTNQSLLDVAVKFLWSDFENYGFVRSGNPGYLHGRPVLAGRRVILTSNDTTVGNKEGIELTSDPSGWLNIFQTMNGQCSMQRQPILFNVNQMKSCWFHVDQDIYSANGCLKLQQLILKILIGNDSHNMTTLGFNKYLGVFGNSKVEHINEWVQVLLDPYPLISNSPMFVNTSNSLTCKNIFTVIFIDIAIAKFGSFYNPQFKIIGSMINFGEPREFIKSCVLNKCNRTKQSLKYKIRSVVNFLDVSRPAVREFAHPPGLEAKLPHDFFYPFFSGGATRVRTDIFVMVFVWFLT